MDLLTPSEGNLIWTLVVFLILVLLLGKFAWKPILKTVNERESSIVDALNQAKLARKEVETLKADNNKILKEAKIERDNILKEAREIRDNIIEEAKEIAKKEAQNIISAAKASIEDEKSKAMSDIKNQVTSLSLSIAESILKQKLDNTEAQNTLVENILNNTNLN